MKLNRRNFIKWGLALGGSGVVSSILPFSIKPAKAAQKGDYFRDYNETKWGACTVNCGARCPLQVRVKDGRIVYLETDNKGEDIYRVDHQIRACVRGRSNRFKIYGPNRLKYPMKRVGARGEGKFQRISWDEALDTIANKMKDIKQRYGNDAFYINYGTGTIGGVLSGCYADGASVISRLMNCYGGYLNFYDDYSTSNIENGLYHMFGDTSVISNTKTGIGHPERAVVSNSPCALANDFADIENSKLVVLFGNNPCETKLCGGSMQYYFNEALQRGGAKLIVIDPRFTDTAANKAQQWVPIRPATDGALVAGLAYVMIKENLVDQKFLDKYCVGFDRKTLPKGAPVNGSYKDYILGTGGDNTPKTPQWASDITGVPVSTIVELAKEIGTTKPVHISQGWGPQRNTNGEQISRAICTLAAMTGCVGIKGGNTGSYNVYGFALQHVGFPQGTNPVKPTLPFFLWTDAIVRGPEMTDIKDGIRGAKKLNNPIKFLWSHASNTLINQHADVNKTIKILKDESLCEMIVDINITMTPSSRFSDILLPDATPFEQIDMVKHNSAGPMPYIILTNEAIKPLYECKPVYEIAAELSKKLGIEKEFTEGRTQEQWVEYLWKETRKISPDVPEYKTMLKQGIYKRPYKDDPYVALKEFRENPTAHPLGTPSGKIEIYSIELQKKAKTWILLPGQKITPLPEYLGGHDTYSDTVLREKYPYQLNGFHFKGRTHSSYWEVQAIRELNPQEVWINPEDAAKKGVKHGDLVELFNDRGKLRTRAKVTNRVMPGVLALGQGAWYRDKNGVDIGGCVNVLTSQEPNPISKGNAQHTALIDFKIA